MRATLPYLEETDFPAIRRKTLETVQVNLGYRCNQQCQHCHVNAGPKRTEVMDAATIADVVAYLEASGAANLDLTGGAPEMNPHFRGLVTAARGLGAHVIDRCNLTVLEEGDQKDTAAFLAQHQVEVVASLPCYQEQNVDTQRGKGVFDKSVRALKRLNDLGYGTGGELRLNLVYNPQGPVLPPEQSALEADYRQHLADEYGIVFDRLLTIANMPIHRFGSALLSKGQFHDYMRLLHGAHQEANLENVMCRTLLSVDWRGYVYDCDFNQMLGLAMADEGGRHLHVRDLMGRDLTGRPILVRDHCYGCTAGQGSSCTGALG